MPDPISSKKYAVSKGPVNRRLATAAHSAAPAREDRPQATPEALRQRVQAAKLRHRLGATLLDRLAKAGEPKTEHPFGAGQAVAGILGTAGAVGLLLGVIQQLPLLIGASALTLAGVGAKLWLSRRARVSADQAPRFQIASLVDPKDVARLDEALDAIALELPQDLVDELAAVKATLVRCVALMADGGGDNANANAFAGDDQLFIRESIRRYLPDSIASYLQVPQKDRASLDLDEGKTALALLREQLHMLGAKLATHEQRLSQRAGDSLLRQQRFLAAKTR